MEAIARELLKKYLAAERGPIEEWSITRDADLSELAVEIRKYNHDIHKASHAEIELLRCCKAALQILTNDYGQDHDDIQETVVEDLRNIITRYEARDVFYREKPTNE